MDCTTHEEHAVDVVNVTVLPPPVVNIVPWHRNFGTIEYRGLTIASKHLAKSSNLGHTSFISFHI